jgi:hypothetical protein
MGDMEIAKRQDPTPPWVAGLCDRKPVGLGIPVETRRPQGDAAHKGGNDGGFIPDRIDMLADDEDRAATAAAPSPRLGAIADLERAIRERQCDCVADASLEA